jgi:hypothetical protein
METADQLFGLTGGGLITGYIRWDTPQNTPGFLGFLDYGTAGGTLLAAVAAPADSYSDLYFSHVAEGDGYYTGLALLNPNLSASTVNLEAFDREGRLAGQAILTLAAGERRSLLLRQAMPALTRQLGGYLRLTATGPVYPF